MNVYIHSLSSYVPHKRVSNQSLEEILDTSAEWIVSSTGIKYRHMAAENEATSDLGTAAAQKLLDKNGIDPQDIDLIILGTSSPDYPGIPSTACIVQHKIGAVNAGAMDVLAACTSFVYCLETARSFILAGTAKNVLVVCSDAMTRIMDWTDRDAVLFGDGAGVALVTENRENSTSTVIDGILRSEGEGADHLKREAGGTRTPIQSGDDIDERIYLKMNGRQVYTFAVRAICDTINTLLERNNLREEDIAWIVPHQANIRIINAAAKRLNYPADKFYLNIAEYANTSAATIPIALDDMVENGLLKRGDLILTVGFGGGLTYGGNLIRW